MSASNARPHRYDIAIVGGGFSGVMLAINAAHAGTSRPRILIVERRAEHARGTAYAAQPRHAILNVPAGAMSAFVDDPGHFVRWLGDADPADYVPRHRYGRYLQALLAQAVTDGHDVECIRADIADLRSAGDGQTLIDVFGQTIASATTIVLAPGAPAPADLVAGMPAAIRGSSAYVADPWTFLRQPKFAAAGDIAVAGSGLTALDVIAEFARSGARNRLHVVSRRGRFPLAHAEAGAGPPLAPDFAGRDTGSVRAILAAVRWTVREAAARDIDWRNVMDGLRPTISALWAELDLTERRRFLRHVRPLFDPHRHRAPAALLAYKDTLLQRGQLVIRAARIVQLRERCANIEVTLQPRGSAQHCTLEVAQIINCGGPSNDYANSVEPLMRNLLRRGVICADPSGLGLRTLADGRLIDTNGVPANDLFTIGWPMRGTLFETTAVRELRVAAHNLGCELARVCAQRRSAIG